MTAVAAAPNWRQRRSKILQSTFQTDPLQSYAPSLRPTIDEADTIDDGAAHQAQWDRAWQIATSAIALPPSVAAEDSFGTLPGESQATDDEVQDSLRLILQPSEHPRIGYRADILCWHAHQVQRHFIQHVLPLLSACDGHDDPREVLLGSVHTLEAAHRQYFYGMSLINRGQGNERARTAALRKFTRDLHAIVGNAMSESLLKALAITLGRLVRVILGMDESHAPGKVKSSRNELLSLLESLARVGLAGERFQMLFAELMDGIMDQFITTKYARRWPSASGTPNSTGRTNLEKVDRITSSCIPGLSDWVENQYCRLTYEVLSKVGAGRVGWSDVEKSRELAVARLATLRIRELFDIVLHWPESQGDLDDLRRTVTTPQRRLQLTDSFSRALHKRLLHPGRSTLEILRVYISMIRTFHALDHSKVLLDRVVRSLQLYLCQRDDAIRIVVTGLLTEESVPDESKDKLTELAGFLNDSVQQNRQGLEDDHVDWDDMEWLPDPIDAGRQLQTAQERRRNRYPD